MWKWVIIAASVPVGLGLLVCAIGALLPRDHVAPTERLVPASPERVAATIRAVEAYPNWRSGLERVEIVERGEAGTRFVEYGKDDPIAFRQVEEAAGERFRSTIESTDLPFGGYWLIVLTPEGGGTRVRIEEHGFVSNVVFRFFSALVFGHTWTMTTWLDDLERAVRA